jgi:hypothetical protein
MINLSQPGIIIKYSKFACIKKVPYADFIIGDIYGIQTSDDALDGIPIYYVHDENKQLFYFKDYDPNNVPQDVLKHPCLWEYFESENKYFRDKNIEKILDE